MTGQKTCLSTGCMKSKTRNTHNRKRKKYFEVRTNMFKNSFMTIGKNMEESKILKSAVRSALAKMSRHKVAGLGKVYLFG